MYVITGATGNIGSKITARLLSQGKPVRLIGRSEDKLKSLADGKTENMVGTLEDASFLTIAFTGATAVFAMIPPNIKANNIRDFQNKIGEAITTAIKNAKVKNVVSLSSIGAHLPEKAGIVQGLYDFEHMLNKLENTNVIHLRAGYFMENLFGTLGSIKQYNMIGTPLKANIPLPMVATEDIAERAAQKLLKLDFSGKSVEYVLGPKDLTYKEMTHIIGTQLGKPDLSYSQLSYEDARGNLLKNGLSEDFTDRVIEFAKGMNEGYIFEDVQRTPRNTTPTTLEKFVNILKQVYSSQK